MTDYVIQFGVGMALFIVIVVVGAGVGLLLTGLIEHWWGDSS